MADELYADLVETSDSAEIKRLKEDLAREQSKTVKLTQELEAAREALQSTEEELATVKRNISAIYHTARKELQRKDALIAELRKGPSSSAST
jgi:chromosome segregation ATPase